METKKCSRCRQEKPLAEFANDKSTPTGLQSWCRACYAEYQRSPNGKRANYKAHRRYMRKLAMGEVPYKQREQKRCYRCHLVKDIAEFSRNRVSMDGHQGYCKPCEAAYQRSPAGRQAAKRYYTSEHGKEKARQRLGVNPNQRRAIKAVHSAVTVGQLVRPETLPCRDCEKSAREYHHRSYEPEYWLDVVPLCGVCHKARHKARRTTSVPVR